MAEELNLVRRAREHGTRTAITADGRSYDYGQLLDASARVASALLGQRQDLHEARVAMLLPPGFSYVVTQWGIWRAGGIAVPLGMTHPPPELEYVLRDAQVSEVVADRQLAEPVAGPANQLGIPLRMADQLLAAAAGPLPPLAPDRRAMILYTSGTTSRPKGVVSTHGNIEAQVRSLVEAWQWTGDDRILHVLPLHHIHGIINVLTCAMWSGAECEFLAPFDAGRVLDRFAVGDLTLFMAVPTIYAKLIAAWEKLPAERRQAVSRGCQRMRLMVSGSAALPVSTLQRWQAISGHVLLERYGMTEIGMALSNPLHGRRVPGCVGHSLPGVQVRRVDDAGRVLGQPDVPGEIEVRGPTVFLEYWNRPQATAEAFHDGWFRTGDIAVIENGNYRILGRSSVDIIKTGGYKVSALEVEEVLRGHPAIEQCAVVGVPDQQWGQRVAACVVLRPGARLELAELRGWAKQQLAPYKVPTLLHTTDALARNAMGKVQKPALVALLQKGSSNAAPAQDKPPHNPEDQ